MEKQIGSYAFIVGVILAIILGLFGAYVTEYVEWITYLMIILGVIIGFMNVAQKESFNFLIAAIALLAVGGAGLELLPTIGLYIGGILTQIAVFVAPAAVIVALKAIYDLAYKKL